MTKMAEGKNLHCVIAKHPRQNYKLLVHLQSVFSKLNVMLQLMGLVLQELQDGRDELSSVIQLRPSLLYSGLTK